MRAEENPLDLNNFPEDYTREGKQVFEDNSSSSSGYRRKKNGGKDGKDECGKVYECRFCSLKFCKSQALGGHMNRHRQERETEALNHARQLVYSNDNPAPHGGHHHHLGCHPMAPGSYHPASNNISDSFRSIYNQPRLFSGSSSSSTLLPPPPLPQPQPQPQPQPSYLYTSPSLPQPPYSSQFPHHQPPINDYYIGHVLHHHQNYNNLGASETNYTCIGAPVGLGSFGLSPNGAPRGLDLEGKGRGESLTTNHQLDQDGLNWGSRRYTNTTAGSL